MARQPNGLDIPIVALLHQERVGDPETTRVVAGVLESDGEVVPAVSPRVDYTVPRREPWVPSEKNDDSPSAEPASAVVIPAPAGLFVQSTPHDSAFPIVAFKVEQGEYGGVEVTPVGMFSDGSTGSVGGSRRAVAQWVDSAATDYA